MRKFIDCARCVKPLKIPYKNHRYEVTCSDGEGERFVVGWTVDSDGGKLVKSVNKHPSWHSPKVEDLEK